MYLHDYMGIYGIHCKQIGFSWCSLSSEVSWSVPSGAKEAWAWVAGLHWDIFGTPRQLLLATGLNYPSVPGWRQCWAREKKASPEGEGDMKRANHGHQNRTKHNQTTFHTSRSKSTWTPILRKGVQVKLYIQVGMLEKQLSLHAMDRELQKQRIDIITVPNDSHRHIWH